MTAKARYALLLAVCLTGPALTVETVAQGPNCSDAGWAGLEVTCRVDAAKAADKPEPCLEAESRAVRWHCVARFSEAKRDPSYCDVLADPGENPPYASRGLCRSHMGVTFGSPAMCGRITDRGIADQCWLNLATKWSDVKSCSKISAAQVREICDAAMAGRR